MKRGNKPFQSVGEDVDKQIADDIAKLTYDFNGLVDYLYPWGDPEFGLDKFPYNQPKKWQRELLEAVSKHRLENKFRADLGLDYMPFRAAISSGHGVGKSALVAMLIECFMATTKDCRGVVTANTAAQLDTKTWPELAKWHNMSIIRHWFRWTASTYVYDLYPEDRQKNYMFNAATVSAENSEAFAGLHNRGSIAVIIFDEASGIEEILYEIADGVAAAGTEFYFFAFGNPTRPDGPFFDCFYKHSAMFQMLRFLDNRTVEGTNLIAQQQIIDKHGEDSDAVRIRVKGEFPTKSYAGFISTTTVNDAVQRANTYDPMSPIIIGVDVARYGDDDSRITVRAGRDARSVPSIKIPYANTRDVAREVRDLFNKLDADMIVIENVGPGAGVIDSLREWGYPVHEFHPNERADDPKRFGNRRSEIWSKMKEWLENRGCIPEDPDLYRDLVSIQYSIAEGGSGRGTGQYLEPKSKMKDRGLPSPDYGDSLAMTFTVSPARRNADGTRGRKSQMAIIAEPEI